MAKSSRSSSRRQAKAAENSPTAVLTEENQEQPAPAQETAAAPPAKNKGGRPPGAKDGANASNRTFFRRLEDIPADDWGNRATIHLYRLEPYTDRLRSGNVTHIMRYSEPIDESRVMMDHGSGKYRAILNFRKPTGSTGDEVGRHEFEILNQAHPPNVPLGEWVDDPRNRKWAWAKDMLEARAAAKNPQNTQTPAARAGEVLETIRAVKELMPEPQQQPANTAASTIDTIKAVRELFPAPAPQTENAMLNTVVTLFTAQLAAAQEESRELRKEQRELRAQPAGAPAANGVGTLKELLGTVKELLPAVKELFPNAGEAVVSAVSGRSRMGGWQEMLQPSITAIAQGLGPMLPIIAQTIFTPRGPAAGLAAHANPGQPAAALPPGQPQQRDPLIGFMDGITPFMLNYLKRYAAGEENFDGARFAEQLFDMQGPLTPEGVEWHERAKQTGVVSIVGLYRRSPYWLTIAPLEPQFIEFLAQFLAYAPDDEKEPAGDDGIVDLTKGDEEVYG